MPVAEAGAETEAAAAPQQPPPCTPAAAAHGVCMVIVALALILTTILALSRGFRACGAHQHLAGLFAQCACLDQYARAVVRR